MDITDTISGGGTYFLLSGTGTLPNVKASLSVSPSSLSFAPLAVGHSTATPQDIFITNTSVEPITINSIAASGDFLISNSGCGDFPWALNPAASCQLSVIFAPTAAGARTGALAIANSVSATPTTVSLTGTGLASSEKLEIYPSSAIAVPDQPVGAIGPDQAISLENTGASPIQIYRVTLTGDFRISSDICSSSTVPGTSDDGLGTYSTCQIAIDFSPIITGLRKGTLTIFDSSPGSPHVVTLTGNGIAATGALLLSDTSLVFPPQTVGTRGGPQPQGSVQGVNLYNPGDSPVTVTSITTSGDFAAYPGCGQLPFVISPNETYAGYCYETVVFSPTAAGTRTGSLIIHTSAGTQAVSLSGTGTPAVPSKLQFIPGSSMDFGTSVIGQTATVQTIYAYVMGSTPVTGSSSLVSGTNASDFSVSPTALDCGSICQQISVTFAPTAPGSRTATLTFKDSVGTQTLTLTGRGVATVPVASIYPNSLNFNYVTQGTVPPGFGQVIFQNNGTSPITLGTVVLTGNAFLKTHGGDLCSGSTIEPNYVCTVSVVYAPPVLSPPSNALSSGSLTFKDSSGNTLASLNLVGYSLIPVQSAELSQTMANFGQYQAVGTSTTYQTGASIFLRNTGTTPYTVGALTGTNLSPATPGAPFSIATANSIDNCSNVIVQTNSYCTVIVSFAPTAVGSATATVNFPVTYADKTKASFAAKVNAIGVADLDSASLSPALVSFSDTGVANTSPPNTIVLTNTGNAAFTVGALSGKNTIVGTLATGEFSTRSNTGSTDYCSHVTVAPGGNCSLAVTLTPSGTGTRTGSISLPVTYFDRTTASFTATLSGAAVAAQSRININLPNVVFPVTPLGSTSEIVQQPVTITNTGNTPVTFGVDSISKNSAEFLLTSDACSGTVLTAGANCSIYVTFAPAANSTGNQTGTLSIPNNATAGQQTIALSGVAITPSQEVELSQTALTFAAQTDGTASVPQTVWITPLGIQVSIASVVLSGPNAGDFQIANGCGGFVSSSCTVTVTFTPPVGATGTRKATIVETDSGPGSPRTITLTATAKP